MATNAVENKGADPAQPPANPTEQNSQKGPSGTGDKLPPNKRCEKCRDFEYNSEDELKQHLNQDCQERTMLCPKNCKAQFKAKDFEKHMQKCAGLKKVDCPYKREGCDIQVLRGDVGKHLKESASDHLDLVKEDLVKRDSANRDEREEMRGEMTETKEEFNIEKERLAELGENLEKLQVEIDQNENETKKLFEIGRKLKSELDAENTEISVCKSYFPRVEKNEAEIEQLKARIATMEQRFTNFETQVGNALSKLNQHIHWIETGNQSVTTHKPQYRNVLVWSVDIAPARQNPGLVASSQRFFTSPKGYCISAKLYIGRMEVAPKQYQEIICITVSVEAGDWDKMLKWPVSGFTSIELLNHNSPSDHYKPGNLKEFQQIEMPQKGKENELVTVHIPLVSLTQVPSKNCYLRNDIVHVRVMVNHNYKVPDWLL